MIVLTANDRSVPDAVFEKLVKDAIEYLRLIHVQPVTGAGDQLVRQSRHKFVGIVGIVVLWCSLSNLLSC